MSTHKLRHSTVIAAAVFCTLLSLPPATAHAQVLVRDDALIMDLLQNGTILLSEDVAKVMPLETSVHRIRRIGLEKDGVRIRAAFRDDSVRIDNRDRGGEKFYDAYYNELAAYIISRYLGLNIVPATVLRRVPIADTGLERSDTPREGTLQLWVENAVVEYDLPKENLTFPGDPGYRQQQIKELKIFDCIIGNVDRHQGNFLVDFNERFPKGETANEVTHSFKGKLWSIDHGKAFHSSARLSGEHCRLREVRTQPVSLTFMTHLRSWELSEVEKALRISGLSNKQIKRLNLGALDKRARKILAHLEILRADSALDDQDFFSSGLWHAVW